MTIAASRRPNPLTVRPPEDVLLKAPIRPLRNRARRLPALVNLARAARGRPEVMVKIASYAKGVPSVRQTLEYLSRDGTLPLVGPGGVTVEGKAELKEAVAGFTDAHRPGCRDTVHIVLSMPREADRTAVERASEAWACEVFGDTRDYLVAHHNDKEHAHAHVVAKMVGHDGRRLRPDREMLQHWREAFAAQLEEQGIEAAATPRDARGRWQRAERQPVRAMRRAGRRPWVYQALYRTLQGERAGAVTPEADTPWQRRMRERYLEVREAWRALAAKAAAPEVARAMRVMAEKLPRPQTLLEALRAEYAAVQRGRGGSKQGPSPEKQRRAKGRDAEDELEP